MADAKIKRRFPCGYEVEIEYKATSLLDNKVDMKEPDGCPIHGKDCRSK